MFRLKDGYKLELQIPEKIKLFGSSKKIIDKTKIGENVPSLEVAEVILVQCNLVENRYQKVGSIIHFLTKEILCLCVKY